MFFIIKLLISDLNWKLYYLFINKIFSVFVKIEKMPSLVTILYQIKSKELNKGFINRLASYIMKISKLFIIAL